MGATCASSSPMSIIVQGRPSPSSASSQPCEENKGFISNLFSSIFSFLFNTNKNSQPCDTSTQNANNSGGASETGGTLASIEFIGHTTAAIECPSVNGVEGGMLLCSFIGDDPGSLTLPGSMNQRSNTEVGGGEGDVYAAGLEELTSDGNTGSRIAVWNNPSNKNGSDFSHAIVLKPGR